MARRSRKSKGALSVNFSGVETFSKMEEGDQQLKVVECSQEDGKNDPYIKWVLENEDGARVYNNTSLGKQSLWNLKAWLEALGVEVPDSEMDIDLEEMVDRELMATIEHETYEGKKRPRIVDFWPVNGEKSTDKDEEESDAPDFDEMDEKELKKFIKKEKLDVDPDEYSSEKKLRKAVVAAYEEANGEEEEEENKGKKGGKKDKPSEDEVDDMSEDELEDVIKEHKLDVDLDDYRTLSKKRAAVKGALED